MTVSEKDDDDLAQFERMATENVTIYVEKRNGAEEFRIRICAAWQKSVQAILETTLLLREARRTLNTYEFRELQSKLPFSKGTLSKLEGIAGDERIHGMADRLPPNWTIIADLQRLSDPNLKKADEAGIITPKLQRQSLRSWLEANEALPARSKKIPLPSLPIGFEAGIRVPHGYPEDRLEELHAELGAFCERFKVQLVLQLDEELARTLGFIKAQATKVIKRERLSRRAVARKQDKAASWPYDWNETDVADARSSDDVKHMFQQLEMLQDFDMIEQKARDRTRKPPALGWTARRERGSAEADARGDGRRAERSVRKSSIT